MVIGRDYQLEIDTINEAEWHDLITNFEDTNIYQTWPYGTVRWARSKLSHVVLKFNCRVVSVAQVRILGVPHLGGIAYVRWGPLWRLRGEREGVDILQNIIRSMREEYVNRRGLILRILPCEFEGRDDIRRIYEEEGFGYRPSDYHTFVVNLTPSLDDINKNFVPRWRTDLNRSKKNKLTIIEGVDDHLYVKFEEIYQDMFDRKKLVDFGDLKDYRQIQKALPEDSRMNIMLCNSQGDTVAGAITSAMGKMGLAVLWATNMKGRDVKGAYLLQWRVIEWLRGEGCLLYDIGGVSRKKNPGGYRFKQGLVGKKSEELLFLGEFEAKPIGLSSFIVSASEGLRDVYRGSLRILKRFRSRF